MTPAGKLPFQKIGSTGWQNLALAALFLSYLIQISFDLLWHNTCGHLAIDFCAFWSAGRIANTNGYPAIYNFDHLRQIELSIFPNLLNLSSFNLSPVAYLPVFILPFQLLSSIDPLSSFFIWAFINLIILVFYLRFLSQKIIGRPLHIRLVVMVLLSLPVYWNFFNGQVNLWLTICIGEFMRANLSGRSFKAGLWLGGLLMKPQILILIVLVLLFQRAVLVLAGFVTTALTILGVSWLMIGGIGIQRLFEIWLGFSNGLPTNDVEIMMNWRMLGLHLSAETLPIFGWIVIGLGSISTLFATIYIWQRQIDFHSKSFVAALFGLLAATCLFAWHSHIHMAMILVPPIIYLKEQNQLPDDILNAWVFLPAGVYTGVFILASLISVNIMPVSMNGILNFLRGASEFGLNIYILIWAINFFRKQNTLIPT